MADEDRLDSLPSALLSVIVSSLSFKEAVRTSILSKRWVNVWQATTNIELQESLFVPRDESDQRIKERNRRRFINFVMNFIQNFQESTVRKFSLSFSNPNSDRGFVVECIRFAVSHNVETLELDFSNEDGGNNRREIAFELPQIVYSHENLRSLKLIACGLHVNEFVNPIALNYLYLGWIGIGSKEIRVLAKKCAKLESLSLIKCWSESNFELGGNGEDQLRLRRLEIEKCRFLDDWMSIEAPKLKYFRYVGSVVPVRIEFGRVVFEEADVDFEIDDDDAEEFGDIANLICSFLDGLYPAKVLTVCSSLLQVIPNGDEPIKLQDPLNAQHLILKANMHPNEFYGITFLLNSCPLLTKLTLILGPAKIFQDYEPPFPLDVMTYWEKHLTFIKCVTKSLKIVEVKGFKGRQHEINFLAYLIHYGRRLRRVNVVVDSADVTNKPLYIERAQILRSLPPASNSIRVRVT